VNWTMSGANLPTPAPAKCNNTFRRRSMPATYWPGARRRAWRRVDLTSAA
jgi:hypothetical protein